MTDAEMCMLIEKKAIENAEPKIIYEKTVPKGIHTEKNIVEIIPCGDYDIIRYTK
jgi:hypothetical protein